MFFILLSTTIRTALSNVTPVAGTSPEYHSMADGQAMEVASPRAQRQQIAF